MKHTIVFQLVAELLHVRRYAVIDAQQVVPESRDHVELLHHTVHIANATKISESYVGLDAFSLVWRLVIPTGWLLDSLHKWL